MEAYMTTERDKFLAELIGGFWHKSVYTGAGNQCTCGNWWSVCMHKHPDFSTWEGFGKLIEWCQQQEWHHEFISTLESEQHTYNHKWLKPEIFANALYEFLKGDNCE